MTEAEWLTCDSPREIMRCVAGRNGESQPLFSRLVGDRKLTLALEALMSDLCGGERYLIGYLGCEGESKVLHDCRQTAINVTAQFRPIAAGLLRDIFGNPFRAIQPLFVRIGDDRKGVYVPDEWCFSWAGSDNVQDLAEAAYQPRDNGTLDPTRLAVLHDALVEAGCDCEELLRHLRGEERCWECQGRKEIFVDPGNDQWCGRFDCKPCRGSGWRPLRSPHYRGCWAVDLLRGEE